MEGFFYFLTDFVEFKQKNVILKFIISLMKSRKNQYTKNHLQKRNSSPVCYAESDELRKEFRIELTKEYQSLTPNLQESK